MKLNTASSKRDRILEEYSKYFDWNKTILNQSTPYDIAKEMVDTIPDDAFTLDGKYIDIFSKTGIFLELIRNRLMNNSVHIEKFPDQEERFKYITNNQLYALVWRDSATDDKNENEIFINMMTLRDTKNDIEFKNMAVLIRNDSLLRIDKIKEIIKESFGDMTFNIVIANPPYDRKDTQMKFASLAHDLCTQYSMIIMPAKWQCKGDKTKEKLYSTFRAKVVPHMSDICFFPDSSDAFTTIIAPDGISYYLDDKNKVYGKKNIENKCRLNHFYNDKATRPFRGGQDSLNNKGQCIIDKLGDFKPYLVSKHTENHSLQLWCNALLPISGGKIDGRVENCILSKSGNTIGFSFCELNTLEEVQQGLQHDNYNPLFTSDSLLEVISFLSYAYTKFVRFLIFNSICGLRSTGQDTWWRFVPDQTFDHIFTDAELYEKYKLSKEDIAVIEGTIAERPLKTVLSWLPQQYITQALEIVKQQKSKQTEK